MYLGERLLYLRRSNNYTQDYVAKYIGVAKSTYCGYEINNREPNIDKINLLSKLYNVTTNFILGTGVFKNWEQIKNNKERIIELLKEWFNGILPFARSWNDDTLFINFIDILIEKIEFEGDNVTIFPKVPRDFSFMNESIVPAKIDNDDAKKQKLLKNYDLMNDIGKDKLVKYSNFMLEDPDYLKESDKDYKMNA